MNWTGDVSTIDNVEAASTNITVSGNYFVTAKFAEIPLVQYDLSINSTEGGSVVWPGEGVFVHDEGTVVGLVTEAEEGYSLVEWTGDVGTVANVYGASTTVTMVGNYSITACFEADFMMTAGGHHTVGLESDGTVVAVGDNSDGECDVDGWNGIVQVAAGESHTVGLKLDKTVAAVGDNSYGQCDVSEWTGIVQVSAGAYHTIGLKWDRTVVAMGRNIEGQCNVDTWIGMMQLCGGSCHTVGLALGGSVIATGSNLYGQCDVDGWDLN